MRFLLLALPLVAGCMSGGPGGTSSTSGVPGGQSPAGSGSGSAEDEESEPEEPTTASNAPDGIQFTIEGKTYTFSGQQVALPVETYVFLQATDNDSSEYPALALRAYATTKGSYPCVDGGTVIAYARSKTERYTSTSCVINIRKLGGLGEIIEGDFSGTLHRELQPGEWEDPEEPSTTPADLAITRATFHMVARRSE